MTNTPPKINMEEIWKMIFFFSWVIVSPTACLEGCEAPPKHLANSGTVKLDPVATERSVADGLKEKRKDRSHNIHRTDIFIPFYTYIQMILWFSCR